VATSSLAESVWHKSSIKDNGVDLHELGLAEADEFLDRLVRLRTHDKLEISSLLLESLKGTGSDSRVIRSQEIHIRRANNS